MATIEGILEGKTGNYFKLDDLGEDAFVITEDIDPAKTEIRTEKVKNKESKNGRDETEYYHILGVLGGVEKDLSLTFTALKQLATLLPRTDNWKGYTFKFNGTKGAGKNIKYQYQVIGKAAPGTQTQFIQNPITDPAGLIHRDLLTAPSGLLDDPFWELVVKHTKNMGEGAEAVNKLKSQGKIYNKDGAWRAVV